MENDIKILYEKIDKHFYQDQTLSKNQIRQWYHLNRYRIANTLVKSKYGAGMKIIDLGCGSCDWNSDALPVFGIDLNVNLLRTGMEKRRLCNYKVADAAKTGLPDASFDIVTSFELLEHLNDYEEALLEAKRLLKEGGHYIISVPFDTFFSLWKPLFFVQVLFQGYFLRNPYYRKRCGHVNHFSPKTIKQAFLNTGYEIETVFDMRRFTIFLCAKKPLLFELTPKS